MELNNRAQPNSVALETTLLVHGVPSSSAQPLADELNQVVLDHGAHPALIGIINGIPTVGMSKGELEVMLRADEVLKANTANLGIALHRKVHAATTVSTTMELAAAAGVQVFATGGIGGVHRGYGEHLDISSDLAAFTRFPVAVVTSGVKSILDVESTREALETLGIPVIGYQTDTFPAFYLRDSNAGVDAQVDTIEDLAAIVKQELARTGRGVVVANPIPEDAELDRNQWDQWLTSATRAAQTRGAIGRNATPAILSNLHQISNDATLTANLALVRSNTDVAAQLAAAM